MNASPPNTPDPLAQEDFTTTQYRELLDIAGRSYRFVRYTEIPAEERFVLWRHDVDYSLNRSLRLAEIEREAGVAATYFVNPHCEFYNLLEKNQRRICRRLVELGHDIGLHFDAEYHDVEDEGQLARLVAAEAALLADICGTVIKVFSFHNPTDFLLSCERDAYGGLINCYSASFKARLAYCSDSNGYWRFRRLRDVLEQASDPRLQVLTHPGWWQESPAPPRQRIFRSVYGRANAVMKSYDSVLASHGRENLAGPASSLSFLKTADENLYRVCDYLWNSRHLNGLLLELYRLHIRQAKSMATTFLVNAWRIPPLEVAAFVQDIHLAGRLASLMTAACSTPWAAIAGTSESDHEHWSRICRVLVRGGDDIPPETAEDGCVYFCQLLARFAVWGKKESAICHDGISNTVSMSAEADRPLVSPPALDEWRILKQQFSAGQML